MAISKTLHLPKNDQGCGWLAQLPPRSSCPALQGSQKADWVVVGAGLTGTAAARQLAALHPNARIVLLEAAYAAEGSSARNSGFLIDATLNEGSGSASDVSVFETKYKLNKQAAELVRQEVERHQIECDWDACGKLYATHGEQHVEKLQNFAKLLGELGLPHDVLEGDVLKSVTGSDYYRFAVRTKGSVLLQPAKLSRGLLDNLPEQVELFEQSPVLSREKVANGYRLTTPDGDVTAPNVIMAVNGFMPELGVKRNRTFSLTLTASMTRPLRDDELVAIGSPAAFGLLSADTMGATLRLTKDKRLLIRNTCEVCPDLGLDQTQIAVRKLNHIKGLAKRYPMFDPSMIEHSWSGIINISYNGESVFEKLDDGLYAAGCYNANGLGLANLYGCEIANLASGQDSEMIPLIQTRNNPSPLPPQPFLYWGARLRLMLDRHLARDEE